MGTAISIAIPGLCGMYFLVAGLVEVVNWCGYALGPTSKFRLVVGVPEGKREGIDMSYSPVEHGRVVFWLEPPGYLPAAIMELALAALLLTATISNFISPSF